MKKQLFSLVMMLAIVVLASTSAWAQANDPLTNRSANAFVMITGSTHTFSSTKAVGNVLKWEVYKGTDAAAALAGVTDITTVNTVADANSIQVTWAESAAGNYYIQATETRAAGTVGADCAVTIRRFYVNLIDFNLRVYASDAAGTELTTATQLAECGNGTVAQYGDQMNGGVGVAFSNENTHDNLGTFVGVEGTTDNANAANATTKRYVTLEVTWGAGVNVADIPVIGSAQFNYTVALTSGAPVNLRRINNLAPDNVNAADNTGSTVVDAAFTVDGALDHVFRYTMLLEWNDRWGTDIVSTTDIKNFTICKIDGGIAAVGQSVIGKEPVAKEINNTSAAETILAAPALPEIGVSQN